MILKKINMSGNTMSLKKKIKKINMKPPLYLYFLALSLILLNVLFIPLKPRTYTLRTPIYTLPVAKDLPLREAVANIASSKGIDKRKVDKLIWCESRWNPNAKCKTSSASGLWQITDVHGLSVKDRLDPIKSTRWAIDKWIRDKGCRAWECC